MDKIKKNFGFGFMRLPKVDGEIDLATTCDMVDAFMKAGFNYFDTAHGYLEGRSESAIKACVTSRYPRESYVLTDKLSGGHFQSEEDIRPLFESQLEGCGVDYFDFYLMHAQCAENYPKYKKCKAYETAFALKKEGKIRHVGISFHDKAAFLEGILEDYPDIEAVQLQFNYVDFDDPSVEARKCWEVCRKHGKPVIVMEPVKGGSLVNLPPLAQEIFDGLGGGSNASYALRFAAGFEGIMMVLSGMSDMAQIEENLQTMGHFKPLTDAEREAVSKVQQVFSAQNLIPCTSCRYCVEGCPQGILIPDLFACLNARRTFSGNTGGYYYHNVHTQKGGKASDCISCGGCEAVCPQHLPIRDLLKEVAAEFEKE